MAESGALEAGTPNLNLSPEEKRLFGQLFRQADTDNVGVVTGEIAVKFFEKTRLDSRILGEIWQIADKENRGFLTPAGFSIVLRLIGHAQAGREPASELALRQGPLPRFEGFAPVPISLAPTPTGTAQPLQTQGTGGGPGAIRIPPLTPEKVAQYAGLFERQLLQGGNILPGEQAKQIFEKSGLPTEVLGRIWQLADTEQRGALVLTEFVIAMHLLTSMKTGALKALPTVLPAALYEAATRRATPSARATSPTSTGPPLLSAVPRQLSGQQQTPMRTGSPMHHNRTPLTAQTTGDGWLITPADKARFDVLYQDLDKSNKGFITGEEAVPFFSQSNLPEDMLAQIWDLADIRSEGRLNRDEFAVAMYLIRQQRSRRDGSSILPRTLPLNLVPPSMRSQAVQPGTASPFGAPSTQQSPPQPQPKLVSALDDLFGLDSSPTPSSAPSASVTGGSTAAADPFVTAASPVIPSSPARPSPTASTFKPFVPSSSFGRTLTAQATGDSSGSPGTFPRPAAPQPSASEDLLGDNDPEISKKLTNDTAELANLSNQIGSLSKQTQELQRQRASAQNELSQASTQKNGFEKRLAQLRALYEKEAKDVHALEEQLAACRSDTKKIQTEMTMLEVSYQDLQNQHRTVLTNLQADQQENASLKERIRSVNAEVTALKPQIEKLRSEARQQKGLVAINKKQLATNEAERDKLKAEADELTKSNLELARQLSSSAPPSAASAAPAQATSPAPSSSSANNPFFRRTGSTDIMGALASPPVRALSDESFDDVFGPSFPTTASITSFQPQVTGNSAASASSLATPTTNSPDMNRQPTPTTEPQPPQSLPELGQPSSSFPPFEQPTQSVTRVRQVLPATTPSLGPGGPPSDSAAGRSAPAPEALNSDQDIPSDSISDRTQELERSSDSTNKGVSVPPASHADTPESGIATAGPGPTLFPAADQAKAKEDFDSAFAGFRASSTSQAAGPSISEPAKGVTSFNTEFPPISELERDEDSDSDDEKGGFDDDFAPTGPSTSEALKAATSSTSIRGVLNDGGGSVDGTLPRGSSIEKSVSSPAAGHGNTDDAIGAAETNDISPTALTATASGVTNAAATGSTAEPSLPASKQTSAFDDLGDDFEGLEDAKEGSADDDFQTISRSGLDDFNPVFDSPPLASEVRDKSDLASATSGVGGAVGANAPFATDSGFDFGGTSVSPGTSNLSALTATDGSTAVNGSQDLALSDAHDWDAIFASLDDAAPPSSHPAIGQAVTKETGSGGRPGPPGRALTEEGEHDDPILKNLTSMGYSRTDALSALEKYDYNLERAANYLASQS